MVRGVGRRGVSPVIAGVLMILLTVVLASIVFLWARGFVEERVEKFDAPIENACNDVRIEASKVGPNLKIVNNGDVDIRDFEIEMLDNKGNSEIIRLGIQVSAKKNLAKIFPLEMSDGKVLDSAVIYPILVGRVAGSDLNSVFTCVDSGVKI